jgi:peptide/nickel transport system ATP-binding protein
MIARVFDPTAGTVRYRGEDIKTFHGKRMQQYRAEVQMVFQDPFGSLNPTQSIGYHLERPLRLHRPELKGKAVQDEMLALLESVGLRPAADYLRRRPHELSGGQRQRVAIARALSVHPQVLLADEPTSMLDVSVRLGILNLLEDLKRQKQLAALYITHDIATARYFAEDTAVLYAGHLVEQGPSVSITDHPQHPYTQLLIEAVPNPSRKIATGGRRRATDIPLWTHQSRGCPFVSRCPRATAICKETMPGPTAIASGHVVRCHHI